MSCEDFVGSAGRGQFWTKGGSVKGVGMGEVSCEAIEAGTESG